MVDVSFFSSCVLQQTSMESCSLPQCNESQQYTKRCNARQTNFKVEVPLLIIVVLLLQFADTAMDIINL